MKRKILIIFVFISLILNLASHSVEIKKNNTLISRQNIIKNQLKERIERDKKEKEAAAKAAEEQAKPPETYTTMYSTVRLHIRQEPNTNSAIVDTVNINTELDTVDNSEEDGWIKIKMDNDSYCYVASRYLSDEEIEIPKPKVVNNGGNILTKSKGVNYFNGHRETWYSQRVLPGKGLKIPGRHVDERGLVCDEDGYICVASNDYSKGTIVETSLGTGKVYDSGCPRGTIDIYTN